jgi:adenylate cyclase
VVGNLGSEERFDYSMIGDAANLASRLEGLGKVFRSPLIVSEDAWRKADGAAYGREIGRVRVVGRSAPVRVFQPAGLAGEAPVFPWWKHEGDPFVEGLEAYYRGDLALAARRFADAPEDPVAGAYLERCRDLEKQALPETWEGVWEMQSK